MLASGSPLILKRQIASKYVQVNCAGPLAEKGRVLAWHSRAIASLSSLAVTDPAYSNFGQRCDSLTTLDSVNTVRKIPKVPVENSPPKKVKNHPSKWVSVAAVGAEPSGARGRRVLGVAETAATETAAGSRPSCSREGSSPARRRSFSR